MTAWQDDQAIGSAQQCENLLSNLEKNAQLDCKPTLAHYKLCMKIWNESGHAHAVDKVQTLFRKVKDRYAAGDIFLRPDAECYIYVIDLVLDSPSWRSSKDLLMEMAREFVHGNAQAKPTTELIERVLYRWAKQESDKDSAETAEQILRHFQELNASGALKVPLNSRCYMYILKGWAYSSHPNGALRAAQALDWMQEIYKKGGNDGARLSRNKYNTVIGALGHRNHAQAADSLLRQMCSEFLASGAKNNAKPGIPDFQGVLTCWFMHQDRSVGAKRAQSLLNLMWTLRQYGLEPDTRACGTVLSCWKMAKDPVKAERFLRQMTTWRIPTTRSCYNKVIEAYDNSKAKNKIFQMRELQKERDRLCCTRRK